MKEFLIKAAVALAAVFMPIRAAIIVCFVLIGVDLVTGILGARKRGEMITSAGLRRTISKILAYESAILISFLAETYLSGPMMPLSHICTCWIAVVETKSILENMNEITGYDIFKTLLKKINSDNNQDSE